MFKRKKKYENDYNEVLDFSKIAYEQLYDYKSNNFLISKSIIDDGYESLFLCYTNEEDDQYNGWVFLTEEDLNNEELDLENTYVVSKEHVYKIFPVAFALTLINSDDEFTLFKFEINENGICGFLDFQTNKQITFSELTGHSIEKTEY